MSIFNTVKLKRPRRTAFNLSHDHKFTGNFGYLYPIYLEEIVPGDRFRIGCNLMVRFQPLVAPIMHQVDAYVHFFFVPNRLIWDNWKQFITGGERPENYTQPIFPYFQYDTPGGAGHRPVNELIVGRLADYLGLQTMPAESNTALSRRVSALPFRAYALIYNEYYRDEWMSDPAPLSTLDGEDTETGFTVRMRAWRKDYFTSALFSPQRGNPANIPVSLPGGAFQVTLEGDVGIEADGPLRLQAGSRIGAGNVTIVDSTISMPPRSTLQASTYPGSTPQDLSYGTGLKGTTQGLHADGSILGVGNVNVDDLRRSMRLQEWLERNAVGGSRYIEQILAHFGVRSSDARLQRPEFLGGGKIPISVSEIPQTSSTDDTSPQANLAGRGLGAGGSKFFNKFFEEHGFIMGIYSVMPKADYYQGYAKLWRKFDRFDYYWPEFAHLGEQQILSHEVFADGGGADLAIFGYTPRYAEYKFAKNRISGQFKTNLDHWHMGRKFQDRPVLGDNFIKPRELDYRNFAVTDPEEHHLLNYVHFDVKAIRPMPRFGTPTL